MPPLLSYTSVHALVCPLVHTSVFLHTISLPVTCAPRYGTANPTFYYWDYCRETGGKNDAFESKLVSGENAVSADLKGIIGINSEI